MTPLDHSERLIAVVGPSGAGKDSVLQAWAALRGPADAPVHLAQRVITRPADGGAERHEPVNRAEFDALREAQAFATWWEAHGLAYGVRQEALAPLQHGGWVVINTSRVHLPTLRRQAPRLSVVEITAPEALRARRLAGRAREDAEAVAARLRRSTPAVEAELTLVNDHALPEVALALHRWWLARAAATSAETGGRRPG